MGALRPAVAAFDRWWWLVALAVGVVIVHLNRDALGMQQVYSDYLCLRSAIVAGLDPAADHCGSPTFPMWGYGWLLVLTRNAYVLLLGQIALATGAAWLFLRALEHTRLLRETPLRVVKAALIVSIPWYAANALRWPYSEAASLLLAAVAVLLFALERDEPSYRLVALSGVLFGLVLNFRSDYIALPVIVVAVVIALGRRRGALAKRMVVWVAALAVVLAPWMVYSARATGHILLTSTNGGHVLYISLGQLPGNPWGITPFDGDPRMHRELDAHLGRRASTLTYESDRFLRSRFVHLVREHPGAWVRKDVRNAVHTLSDGLYNGEFTQQQSCGARCWVRYGFTADGTRPVRSRLTTLFGSSGLNVSQRIRFALVELSAQEGRFVSFVGFLAAGVVLLVALRRRNLLLALVAVIPVYAWLMNTFTYELPSYSSNAYVFVVAVMAIAGAGTMRAVAARRA